MARSYKHLACKMFPGDSCHDEWAAHKKAAREAASALRKRLSAPWVWNEMTRPLVADAVCGRFALQRS